MYMYMCTDATIVCTCTYTCVHMSILYVDVHVYTCVQMSILYVHCTCTCVQMSILYVHVHVYRCYSTVHGKGNGEPLSAKG